jgi:hypothetical protein
VAGSCEHGDEPSGSGATELVISNVQEGSSIEFASSILATVHVSVFVV